MKKLLEPFQKTSLLIYPRLCEACGQRVENESDLICFDCRLTLPRTDFHLHEDNPVMKVFWGRIPLVMASSFLYFSKESRTQNLLHSLKYKGFKEIGEISGTWFGNDLIQNKEWADSIDFIVPVPLHPKKFKKRGYNQSEYIARGLSAGLHKEISLNNLVREKFTETQTRKSRIKRWENVSGIFSLRNPQQYKNKHILLVDDVITTGSTIEACYIALRNCEGLKLSISSLAYAHV